MGHLARRWVAWMGGRGVEERKEGALWVEEASGIWAEELAAGLGAHPTGQQGGRGRHPLLHAWGVARVHQWPSQASQEVAGEVQAGHRPD